MHGGTGGEAFGGAFYGEESSVSLNLNQAYIQGNRAIGGNGGTKGGLAGGGAVQVQSAALAINQSVVVGNSAVSGDGAASGGGNGGAIYLFNPTGNVAITDTVIAGNSLSLGKGTPDGGGGGGLYFQGATSTLTHVTVDGNTIGPNNVGQAMYAVGSTVNINNSIVSNHAGTNSFAIFLPGGSQVNLNQVLSYNNPQGLVGPATSGGGVSGSGTVIPSAATAQNLYVSPGAAELGLCPEPHLREPGHRQGVGEHGRQQPRSRGLRGLQCQDDPGRHRGTPLVLGPRYPPSPSSGSGATGIQLAENGKGVKAVVVQFNVALNAKQAKNARAYALHKLSGRDAAEDHEGSLQRGLQHGDLEFLGPDRSGLLGATGPQSQQADDGRRPADHRDNELHHQPLSDGRTGPLDSPWADHSPAPSGSGRPALLLSLVVAPRPPRPSDFPPRRARSGRPSC